MMIGAGFGIEPTQVKQFGVLGAGAAAVGEMWHITVHVVSGLGRALTSAKARSQVHSIIGITEETNVAVSLGAGYALVLLGFVSLVLGVFNLLPFLPLDGGSPVGARRKGPRQADLGRRDVSLQFGRDRPAAVPRDQRVRQRHRPSGRIAVIESPQWPPRTR